MEPRKFELSLKRLASAIATEDRNFAFVIGGEEYWCSRVQAAFVSNKVRRLLASDKTVESLTLDLTDNDKKFQSIVQLMNGESIEITPDNVAFLEECARQLENDELMRMIVDVTLEKEEVSSTNLVERFRLRDQFHSNCQKESDYAASHFWELPTSVYAEISLHNLEAIITNPLLQLDTEDQLFHMISTLVQEQGDTYAILFRYVHFAFLSPENLSRYLDIVFPDLIDESMWQSMRTYLRAFCISRVKYTIEQEGRHRYEVYTPAGGPFGGIMSNLREKCLGNPHEKGIIAISASGSSSGSPYYVVNYGSKTFWYSSNSTNSWILFDFKSNTVCLSGYSIRTGKDCNKYHPLSWVIEVSNDSSDWKLVDERETKDLAGDDIVHTYECNQASPLFWRYVRMKQTRDNFSQSQYLCLSEIEFFGRLASSPA